MVKFFILSIVGFLMGIVTIVLGGGGGAIYVGILTLFFNISPAVATSTSLATMFPTAAVGAFSHWKAGNVNGKTGMIMLAGGAVGSIIGSVCSGYLPAKIFGKLIGAVIILLSILMVVSILRKKHVAKAAPVEAEHATQRSLIAKAVAFGAVSGIISGLVGTSGTTAIIAGLTILGCSALEVVGTSVFVMAGISVIGFVTRLGVGSVDWPLVLLLSVSAISGAIIGSILLRNVKQKVKSEKRDAVLQSLMVIGNLAIGIAQLLK